MRYVVNIIYDKASGKVLEHFMGPVTLTSLSTPTTRHIWCEPDEQFADKLEKKPIAQWVHGVDFQDLFTEGMKLPVKSTTVWPEP